MFGKSASSETPKAAEQIDVQHSPKDYAAPKTQRHQHTFISKDAKLTGDIVSTGDVTIEGILDGRIECRSLTLSDEPCINGSVEAETVHVCGSFEGDLHAKKVVLAKTARMTGNVFQETLEIHPGAVFEGQVSRRTGQPANGTDAPVTTVTEGNGLDQTEPDSHSPA